MTQSATRRRGLIAAIACTGFVLTLPGVFGHLTAVVEGVLFDTAGAQTTNTTSTVSFTENTTLTRVDLPNVDGFETRVVAERDGVVVFDQVVSSPPGSTAFDQAMTALADACSVSGPTLVSSSDLPATVFLGDVQDHFDESSTLEETLGPNTIFVGPNRTERFVVAAGTLNINQNFHTEFFVNQVFQTTVTHQATYGFVGGSCSAASPTPTDVPADRGPRPSQASAATPIPAVPRTAG